MVHDAFQYILHNVDDNSRAVANWEEMDDMTKVKLSELMKEAATFQKMTLGEQKRDAEADPRYKEHIKSVSHARFLERKHFFTRKNCELVIMAWQTQQADARALDKVK